MKLRDALLLIYVVSLTAVPARAQVAIEPYFGVLVFDDSGVDGVVEVDPGALVGGRLVIGVSRGWRLESGYGFSPLSVDGSGLANGEDIDAHLAYGGVSYVGGSEEETSILVSGGFGVVALSSGDLETATDPLVTVGIGFTHPIGERVAFRGEARDNIVFCSSDVEGDLDDLDEVSACLFDDQTLNHIELSGGVEIWF